MAVDGLTTRPVQWTMHRVWGGRERHVTRGPRGRVSSEAPTSDSLRLLSERDSSNLNTYRRLAVRTSGRGQRPPLARAPLLSGPSACGGGGPAPRSARTAPPRA
eukprot:CAMPEP_0185412610 /NCGR_PEP_ID=MMETSP1365-20130426/4365_1 /TAXON_ID=38817 /ORGANISM="Gephyrocapsa oceanica, Strain RCC1303" /LENGTH=103 /DNA_ID=CAMNT_0028015347 /DNA_START=64 /DNA_END=372 /DNA_ORIENTATION=+